MHFDQKLSIIIPVFNSESYLEECIQSIIKQTFLNWELIIINDGSSDDSLQICKEFALSDSRISVYTQENKGQASARNKGLEHAKGDFIAFIDSDDTVSLDLFAENIQIMELDSSIDILQFPVLRGYGSNHAALRVQKQQYIADKSLLFHSWLAETTVSWIVCDKIFKRELFDILRFKEGMIYEDNYLMAEVLSEIKTLFISEKGIYYYHVRENSTTTSPHSMRKELDTQKVSLLILEKLKLYQANVNLKLIILNRIFNVYQSLCHNYKSNDTVDSSFIDELNVIGAFDILKSTLSSNQKIKLCMVKIIGAKNYLKLYNF